ncbi:MAG: HAD family hydrolase [Nitrospinales bacterium]
MRKIDLFVYDFDGTLVDSRKDIANSVNLTLERLGLEPRANETIYPFIGNGVGKLLSGVLAGTSCGDLSEAVDLFKKFYAERLLEHTYIYPNCRETLEFFSHKKHAILSNKPESFIRQILAELDFQRPFAAIVGGDTLESRKPDPQGLLHLLASQKTPPANALMVGDIAVDIETGRRANVLTCGVTYGLGDRSAFEKADYIIDDLAELKTLFN